jgi:hypothetical protein
MSKSGRLLKGKQVVFHSHFPTTKGLVNGQAYTVIRSCIQDGQRCYKVRDKSGNVYTAPEIFFSVK